VPYSTGYLLAKTFDPRAWVLLAPLLVVLILLAARGARREAAVVAAIGILCFASLVLAYWTTPFELHFHLATTARRVITGPLFAWVFLVPLLFAARPPGDPATLNRP
jgi:peptidoglycan/LPS O-acetylase OafA/YrhL